MELIIKPLEACNFKCTFCSSTNIAEDANTILPLDYIFSFLERFPTTKTIIVNGGEPLLVKPEYYWSIIRYFEEHNLPTILSFTSNLWVFYKNPRPWIPLFKHPQVGVGTSFNYGGTRLITEKQPLTEEIFLDVMHHFNEHIGYYPEFISVINNENFENAIDNVLLAKQIGVVCKLNYAMCSGAQTYPFMLAKIYQLYVQIYKHGLAEWEYNTKQFISNMVDGPDNTTCPLSRRCDEGIRCIQPDGDYYSCGSFADDKLYSIDFDAEMSSTKIATPLQDDVTLQSLKNECFQCPMFNICNGCRKTIYDMKQQGDDFIETHCGLMKQNYIDFNTNQEPTKLLCHQL